MKYLVRFSPLAFVSCLVAAPLLAQETVRLGSELEGYLGILHLEGMLSNLPVTYRSLSTYRRADARVTSPDHLWAQHYPLTAGEVPDPSLPSVRILSPEAVLRYNSGYPRAVNEGAVWVGVGLTASVSAGAELRWGPLTTTLLPTFYQAQNNSFETIPSGYATRHEMAYPWHRNIDLPQRMGTGSVTAFDWGQTGLRIDLDWFTAGVSSENVWLGPAFRNGVIMGNAAPGMLHLDLGTGRPVGVGVGDLEAHWIVGHLAESDYFDADPDNDSRVLFAFALDLQPRWIPGLHIGGQRVLYEPSGEFVAGDLLSVFGVFFREATVLPDGSKMNDTRDQLVSAHLRWGLPSAGFETYLEWARNDYSGELRDFLLEPDHSSGYTVGARQQISRDGGIVRLRAEVTHLGRYLPAVIRASPTFYVHSIAEQGYTNRGRPMGAWIGPGSQSQFLGVDWYSRGGRIGAYLERV